MELAAFRRPDTANLPIVMVDGDDQGAGARLRELQAACEEAGVPNRAPDERVLILVPTWRIETWLAYLAGETICETERNYPRLARKPNVKDMWTPSRKCAGKAISEIQRRHP